MRIKPKGAVEKRLTSMLVMFFMLTAFIPGIAATADTTTAVVLGIGSVNAMPDVDVQVPVTLTNVGAGINNADYVITYPANFLTFKGITNGSLIKDVGDFSYNNVVDASGVGHIYFLFNDESGTCARPISIDGLLASICFHTASIAPTAAATPPIPYSVVVQSVGAFSRPDDNLTNIAITPGAGGVNVTVPTLGNLTMSAGMVSGAAGTQVTVPIKIVNNVANGVNSCDFTLKYDNTKLSVVSVVPKSIIPNADNFTSNSTTTPGAIKFWYSDESQGDVQPVVDAGAFAQVTFNILPTATGFASISFNMDGGFVDKNLNPVTASGAAGGVTVNAANVKYGDVDGDNQVTALDILSIRRYILKLNSFTTPNGVIAADVDGDGQVTALDILSIRRYILKLIQKFPAEQ